jgi:hypothetical protein
MIGAMRSLGFLAALALILAPSDADAFCRSTTCTGNCKRNAENCKIEGAPLFWSSLCVSFSLDSQASEHISLAQFKPVVYRSVAAWSSLKCPKGEASIAFQQYPNVTGHKAEYNPNGGNANVLLWQDTKWSYTGVDNTLAKTTVTYDTASGEILDADIEFNHAYNEYTIGDKNVKYDLESIMTHEFGHFLGLDHSDDPEATMNASYDLGAIDLRTPEDDDIGGICTIYTPKRTGVCDATPRGGFSDKSGQEAESAKGCSVAPDGSGGGRLAPSSPARGLIALDAVALAFALVVARRRRLR